MEELQESREQFQGKGATLKRDPGNKDLKVPIGFCTKGVFSNPGHDGPPGVQE